MLQNRTMASKMGNFNIKKVQLRSSNLRSLSTTNKIILKEKLTAELALVRSTIDKIGRYISGTEQCYKRASNNTTRSSNQQQQVPSNRKRKSSEMTQVVEKVKNINEQIRIEAQIKAVVDQKVKSELRMNIKKEREASRLALEKMEATIEINDYNQVTKELKELGCQNISFYVLRHLGLFLKDDDYDDHQTAQISALTNHEIEEGEIVI